MLTSLRIRDLATVADVTIGLGPGLNVLTGETGAGKSMLVDGLALLLGDRADRAAIRPGASRLVVEGVFAPLSDAVRAQLGEHGLDAEDPMVIRREVASDGRSRAWVNGSPTTIGVLKELAALLVDLHGQHQTIDLARAMTQRDLLDAHADAGALRAGLATAVHEASEAAARLDDLVARRAAATQRADWLRHVVAEIDAARIRPGELEDVTREATRLGQATALGDAARELSQLLDGEDRGLRTAMARLGRSLDHLARLDPDVGAWRELLDTAWSQLDELSRMAADYQAAVRDDPDRRDRLERRREELTSLARKHGGTLDHVTQLRASAAEELDLLDRADLDERELRRAALAARQAVDTAARALTARRTVAAEALAAEVTRMLPGLGLGGARFEIALVPREVPLADGGEAVQFTAALNAGMAPRPVADASSGGELSRLMLALKVAVARHDATPTLVFDEIDQGIGGETGRRVGAALASVARRHQVLVITHLPQIAARADRHLLVAKGTRSGIATSDVSVLHGEDRVAELARMLGKPDDPAARRLALALLHDQDESYQSLP
jgi:DNA repair protein RecN (Recombination protein N)